MYFEETKKRVFKKLGLEDVNPGCFHGQWGEVENRELIESRSPINGKPLGKIALASEDDYDKVVKAAREAQKKWAEIPGPKRGEIIRKISDGLVEYKETLGLLVSLEAGKTISEGQGEVQEMIDIGYFAVGLSRQIYGYTMASEREEHRMYEQWQPLGTIGIITAFNFPTAVWSWNSLIASVMGDTSVWKPSSKSALCGVACINVMNRILEENGVPPIFFLAAGRGSTVGNLMGDDSHLPLVSFTGSVKTGKKVSTKVNSRLGRSLLELGGNNGAIVTPSVDPDVAVKGVAFGALATAGQRCTTTRRMIVHKDIYDSFVEKMVRVYENVEVGNPLEEGILVGPLIDDDAVADYFSAIEKAKRQGGKVLCGADRVEVEGMKGGYYVKPTIIEAERGMDIVREETFAPILYVMKYSTIEEALEIHNDVPQGLSSSIFTKEIEDEEYFLSHRGSDCGIANVNTSTAGAEIGGAFGGEKDTGGGRESGSDAWKAYARRQTVTINYGKDIPLSQGVKFDIGDD